MKQYEIMTIYKIGLGDQGAKNLSAKVKELIDSMGGKITKDQYWGKRKFAYMIKNTQEGYYDVLEFGMDSNSISKFKDKLNILNGLLRYLITAKS
ncbi:MAG TPA: 30S ribosomal protein S6 [bacterium]|jgi:small subunit ribosomal protein S6|nr:30S ribosomal protein S6 [bacterium]HOA18286.1 30S ribosomal protein S6 [bacterium]